MNSSTATMRKASQVARPSATSPGEGREEEAEAEEPEERRPREHPRALAGVCFRPPVISDLARVISVRTIVDMSREAEATS